MLLLDESNQLKLLSLQLWQTFVTITIASIVLDGSGDAGSKATIPNVRCVLGLHRHTSLGFGNVHSVMFDSAVVANSIAWRRPVLYISVAEKETGNVTLCTWGWTKCDATARASR